MNLISHRRNRIEELRATPSNYGVEIDIRSRGDHLVLAHDAFAEAERFDEWLKEYHHGTLILNVKEEGLEDSVLEHMRRFGIEDFFFLDQSFPFLIKTANRGEHRCAVRVSEFESVDTALTLSGKVNWVWVDCFTQFPLDKQQADKLHNAGFKLCLVSPELQGRSEPTEIASMRALLDQLGISCDAVCTKTPEVWR